MKNISFYDQLIAGVNRDIKKFLYSTFTAYVALWAMVEPILGFLEIYKGSLTGLNKFLSFLILSVIIGSIVSRKPKEIVLKYNNSKINIKFGNIFQENGLISIPTSRDFFETEVIKSSLLGQLIEVYIKYSDFNNGILNFKNDIRKSIDSLDKKYIISFDELNGVIECELGSTLLLLNRDKKYLLFSLTKTELINKIPIDNCNLTNLVNSLEVFYSMAKNYSRGDDINIPLVGSGVTGVNLYPMNILSMNISVILSSINKNNTITPSTVRILLHPNLFPAIDLSKIEESWPHK